LKKSADSFKLLGKRELALEKGKSSKKDEVIEDLKRQLENAQVDARQNILNMKEIKKTLGGIAVGNMKVREVASLLPQGDEIDVMDLTAIESVLPQDIDMKRTKFLSPRPPPSEIKNALRYNGVSAKKIKDPKMSNTVS